MSVRHTRAYRSTILDVILAGIVAGSMSHYFRLPDLRDRSLPYPKHAIANWCCHLANTN